MSSPIPAGLFSEPSDPAADADIQEVETELGVTLPDEFSAFLREVNGGVLTQPNTIKRTYYFHLEEFFSAGDNGACDMSLLDVVAEYEGRIPPEFIPVLRDKAGNVFCLGIKGDHQGEVYAWDQEFETREGEEPSMTNMHILAPSFNAFLEILKA